MDTLQVIAEPKRRQILALVWDRELTATEIASQFDVTFGAISQHLAVLREAELVQVRKEGNHRIYRADQDALGPYRSVLEPMWRETLGTLASAIETAESEKK
ncbi:MAG: metalloregulator ArsR/SmtB family transcription factor [Acidimicrobiia bacterium]|nr:metalloregulator ArsR/SmtB family transcription factor [Acidimicrobiia bacterium]MDH3463877.1 metalloregulator ArsR/SmtB family transcription factor [Acidimicrobiia bacterium]